MIRAVNKLTYDALEWAISEALAKKYRLGLKSKVLLHRGSTLDSKIYYLIKLYESIGGTKEFMPDAELSTFINDYQLRTKIACLPKKL